MERLERVPAERPLFCWHYHEMETGSSPKV